MAKYIYLYIIIFSAFLIGGFSSSPTEKPQKSQSLLHQIQPEKHQPEILYQLSHTAESGGGSEKQIVYDGLSHYRHSAQIGPSVVYRPIQTYKTIRFNLSLFATRMARFLRITLPENSLSHLYCYSSFIPYNNKPYIYTIRHILI